LVKLLKKAEFEITEMQLRTDYEEKDVEELKNFPNIIIVINQNGRFCDVQK